MVSQSKIHSLGVSRGVVIPTDRNAGYVVKMTIQREPTQEKKKKLIKQYYMVTALKTISKVAQ